jgi:hypothetical protein
MTQNSGVIEAYPIEHFNLALPPAQTPAEDEALRLGLRNVTSWAHRIGHIAVPDMDLNTVIDEATEASVLPYRTDLKTLLRDFPPDGESPNILHRIQASLGAILALEDEAHGLHEIPDAEDFQVDTAVNIPRILSGWHLDAGPYWGPGDHTNFNHGGFGTIRYAVTIGSPRAVTNFIHDSVSLPELRGRNSALWLKHTARSTPGDVIRFSAESTVHRSSPIVYPRIFATASRLRNTINRQNYFLP